MYRYPHFTYILVYRKHIHSPQHSRQNYIKQTYASYKKLSLKSKKQMNIKCIFFAKQKKYLKFKKKN